MAAIRRIKFKGAVATRSYPTPHTLWDQTGRIVGTEEPFQVIALDDEATKAYGHRTYYAFPDEIEEVK